jgi:hypothetical protein
VSERIEFRKKQRLAPSRALSAAALVFVAFAAVLLFSVLRLSSRGSSATEEARAGLSAAEPVDESISRSRRNAIVTAAESVGPAVVSIGVVATRIVRGVNPMYDEFFDFFFRDFLPPTRQYKYRESIPRACRARRGEDNGRHTRWSHPFG